jgi:hypothetical protein
MESFRVRGWAEELADGSHEGEICLEGGDDISVIVRRLATSSTAYLDDRFHETSFMER